MKNCTPLWREARFQVKMCKAPHVRTTFGSWDVLLHAVVARSTFRSQNAQNTPAPDHFWKLRCRKSAHCCGAKHISKSTCTKHLRSGPLLEVEMSKKRTPLWREAHFKVKMLKTPHARTTFEGSDVVLRGRRKGFCTLPKVSKTWGFCSISKNDRRRGIFEEDLQRCIFRGRRSARDMFIRAVRRSGRWFPGRGCILEHQICRFAKMILRDRCSTSHDLASLFRGRRNTLDRWSGKNRKTHWYEAVSSALNFPYLKEVSQNCFVFDVANFENWRCLAELLLFGWCQVPKLRKSRRTASFWMLSSSKTEEVSQNSCVFKLEGRQIDRWHSYNCNYNYKYHYTLLLQPQVQIYYATLQTLITLLRLHCANYI